MSWCHQGIRIHVHRKMSEPYHLFFLKLLVKPQRRSQGLERHGTLNIHIDFQGTHYLEWSFWGMWLLIRNFAALISSFRHKEHRTDRFFSDCCVLQRGRRNWWSCFSSVSRDSVVTLSRGEVVAHVLVASSHTAAVMESSSSGRRGRPISGSFRVTWPLKADGSPEPDPWPLHPLAPWWKKQILTLLREPISATHAPQNKSISIFPQLEKN